MGSSGAPTGWGLPIVRWLGCSLCRYPNSSRASFDAFWGVWFCNYTLGLVGIVAASFFFAGAITTRFVPGAAQVRSLAGPESGMNVNVA